ncbi:mitochondrial ribosomal protein L27-domain-containing protein [Pavlovales sp. CCMP2436]|nr:mitochondrial ribosomal protein L27-domain-containing protein [Pavlovales sp. CCMP2436]
MSTLLKAFASVGSALRAAPALGAALLPFGSRGYRTSRLTQKMGRRFNKGRGAKSFGYMTTKGAFVLTKMPQYIVPDMSNCKLKPYVSYDTWTGWDTPSPTAAKP